MARASNAKSNQDAISLTEATAAAAGTMLRLVGEAGAATAKADKIAVITHLARLCDEAAEHMEKAQTSMFEGKHGGESAIEHLDAALICLNRLVDESKRHKTTPRRAAKSA